MVFSPNTIKGVISPDTTVEQRKTMEQPPSHDSDPLMHEDQSPLHQHEEQELMEVEMAEQGMDKTIEEIIREKYVEITEFRDNLSKENPEENKGKGK